MELVGKYNRCKVFTDRIENEAIRQIINLLNQSFMKDSSVRIMPDCHAGYGCVIGTTMTLMDKVVPNLVGVDIGCGMLTIELKEREIDLEKLDQVIRNGIPSGFAVHEAQKHATPLDCEKLVCQKEAKINASLAYRSVGTLGGGNHFIEVDTDSEGRLYLVIHTGSRHLGLEVAHYYQDLAWKRLTNLKTNSNFQEKKQALIETLKIDGRQSEIEAAVKHLQEASRVSVPKDLAYVEGADFDHYLHDMRLVQAHASANRAAIASVILNTMDLTETDRFETVHNYIDTDQMVLRKGAVSARKEERLLIPMNMRDGSLICIGKGNKDWNESAPHGAGRLLSRSKAKETISLADFKASMAGIYTTSVNQSTIDESPFAYKPMDAIIKNIGDTVDIVERIKPVYNFKAGGD